MDLSSLARKWSSSRLLILAVAACAVATALWYFSTRVPPAPQRTLRIGFESNPPVQIRTENGFSGLAVETVNEAAKRAGIKLEWVETGTSSDEAFGKGLVDLWPLMVDYPYRRKHVHFARPWMHTSDILLVRDGLPNPDHRFSGSIAVFKMPLHVRLAREQFPEAHIVEVPNLEDIIKQACKGTDAGFIEARVAMMLLREKFQECPSPTTLRVQGIPGLKFDAGLASTFESAVAADRIQGEIDNMFRDGMLAGLIAKYSYFGLDDTWASYEQIDNEKKWRWLTWAIGGLAFALSLTLWQANSLRQRRRAEVVLRESEERFRNMADTAPVMIWVAGPDKLCTYFNKRCLDFTGRSMEQKIGDGWITGIHPEDREGFLATYSSSFDAREQFETAFRLRRADGEYRWALTTGAPRFASSGAFSGYIGSCVDVTDLRNAQEQALARQKLESLGVLAGGIAHDFNNLLGGILAEAELVEAELAAGLPPNEEVQRIKTATIRGSEIVRELMIYAGENQQNLNETVDVSRLVEEMLKLLNVSISKHVTLKTDFPGDLPNVWGNAPQIRQVMMNLVLNASEAIGDKEGVIAVAAAQVSGGRDLAPNNATEVTPGDYVRIEVSDTGCGMTDETKAKIFDPFFSSKFPGRGLGLAVVQGIVRDLGGAINIVSAPGQGTVFQVLLPSAAKGASEIRTIITFGELEKSNAGNGTILMVEDEETLRQAVAKGLRK
jgi:PAS domain S-box-containing protein